MKNIDIYKIYIGTVNSSKLKSHIKTTKSNIFYNYISLFIMIVNLITKINKKYIIHYIYIVKKVRFFKI